VLTIDDEPQGDYVIPARPRPNSSTGAV
jgi:hypothetical protein